MQEGMLRIQEAAEFLGLSVNTLNGWRRDREGPPYFKVGSRVVYSVEDLRTWLASRRVVPVGAGTPVVGVPPGRAKGAAAAEERQAKEVAS